MCRLNLGLDLAEFLLLGVNLLGILGLSCRLAGERVLAVFPL